MPPRAGMLPDARCLAVRSVARGRSAGGAPALSREGLHP